MRSKDGHKYGTSRCIRPGRFSCGASPRLRYCCGIEMELRLSRILVLKFRYQHAQSHVPSLPIFGQRIPFLPPSYHSLRLVAATVQDGPSFLVDTKNIF